MPFAGYEDFADCVKRNQDKSDPAAYCAYIMRAIEGKNERTKRLHIILRKVNREISDRG